MAAAIPKKVAIIIASTRPVRIGPEVVGIIHNILKSSDISPAPELSSKARRFSISLRLLPISTIEENANSNILPFMR